MMTLLLYVEEQNGSKFKIAKADRLFPNDGGVIRYFDRLTVKPSNSDSEDGDRWRNE